MMNTVEMRFIRKIHRKTLDQVRNEELRQESNIENIIKKIRTRERMKIDKRKKMNRMLVVYIERGLRETADI